MNGVKHRQIAEVKQAISYDFYIFDICNKNMRMRVINTLNRVKQASNCVNPTPEVKKIAAYIKKVLLTELG